MSMKDESASPIDDSYLVRVIRLLGRELHELAHLCWNDDTVAHYRNGHLNPVPTHRPSWSRRQQMAQCGINILRLKMAQSSPGSVVSEGASRSCASFLAWCDNRYIKVIETTFSR